jgi:hypothetical protein
MRSVALLILLAGTAHSGESMLSLTLQMRHDALLQYKAPTFGKSATLEPSKPKETLFSMFTRYPLHKDIQTTVFWCGEKPYRHDPGNLRSAYDPNWLIHHANENPFYAAVPYCDLDKGHTKPEAASQVPWFRQRFQADGVSVMKGHWIEIWHGQQRCFARIQDCGPYRSDDADYVFRNARPLPHANNSAGLDVSPAVQQFLRLSGLDVCSWRFVNDSEVPPGPWNRGPVFARK